MSSSGAWNVEPIITDGGMPQKLATGFTQAFQEWDGASFNSLVYCGSQVVNGTNHMFICEETTVTNPPSKHVAKVVLHETLPAEGKLFGDFSVLLIETIV